MDTLMLPVIAETKSLRDALSKMTAAGRSGAIIKGRTGLRLLKLDAAVEALNARTTTVGKVKSAPLLPKLTDTHAAKFSLNLKNLMVTRPQTEDALRSLNALCAAMPSATNPSEAEMMVVTYHESIASDLRAAPAVWYCKGARRHMYTAANRPANGICPLDKKPVERS